MLNLKSPTSLDPDKGYFWTKCIFILNQSNVQRRSPTARSFTCPGWAECRTLSCSPGTTTSSRKRTGNSTTSSITKKDGWPLAISAASWAWRTPRANARANWTNWACRSGRTTTWEVTAPRSSSWNGTSLSRSLQRLTRTARSSCG